MEGIIAKRKDSLYRPGKRTSGWLKIKARLQQEFVVGGFTAQKAFRRRCPWRVYHRQTPALRLRRHRF
ncbi:MAG: hypothetical protein JO025_10115 [Verrucomicrobia bacterium]|nr:hypothetical protein [Verrucomicrobiota bacterium]